MTPGRAAALGTRDERLFLLANFISNLGNGIQIIASAYIVLLKTNSVLSVGGLFIVSALPQALVAAASGVLADRGHQKSLCIVSDIVRAACVALIPIALITGTLAVPVLYAATFVVALFDAVFAPVGSSWMQNLLDRSHYGRFSRNMEVSTQGAALISSAVGGFCVQWLSADYVFGFNALTFVVSAAVLSLMSAAARQARRAKAATSQPEAVVPAPEPARAAAAARGAGRSSILAAIVLFSQNRIISTVMNTLMIVLVIKAFQQGIGILGLIDAIAGLGFTAGALAFAAVHRRYTAAAILVSCSAITAIFIFPQPLLGVAGLAVAFTFATFVYGISRPAARLILMNSVADQYSGRIFGAANAFGFVGGAVGTVVISGIVDRMSIAVGYFSVGGYFLVVTLLGGLPLLRHSRSVPT